MARMPEHGRGGSPRGEGSVLRPHVEAEHSATRACGQRLLREFIEKNPELGQNLQIWKELDPLPEGEPQGYWRGWGEVLLHEFFAGYSEAMETHEPVAALRHLRRGPKRAAYYEAIRQIVQAWRDRGVL